MTNPIDALEALVEKWRIDGPIREYGQWQCAKQLEPILQSLREGDAFHWHQEWMNAAQERDQLREERERYREALERIADMYESDGAEVKWARDEAEAALQTSSPKGRDPKFWGVGQEDIEAVAAVAKDSDIPPNLEWYNGNIIDGDTNLTEDSDDRGPDPQRVDPELMRLMEPQFYSNPPTTGAVAKEEA